MKYTITDIVGWQEDIRMEMGDASHIGDGEVMRGKFEEYDKKIIGGKWPGLPFTCEAESADEAIDKYNEEHCKYDYYKADEAEFGEGE